MARASIIIPMDQRTRFLGEALDSALAQTYPDVEVIAVADGPTDAVRAVLAPYGDRIRYVAQDQQGPSAARNTGARTATGEYLLFLDNDDRITPRKLEQHIAVLRARPAVDLTYSRWHTIGEDGRILGEAAWRTEGNVLQPLILHTLCLSTTSVVVMRRSLFERFGGFDETLIMSADYDLWLRMASAGVRFTLIDQPLTQYRVHADSLTNSKVTAARNDRHTAEFSHIFSKPELRPFAARSLAVTHAEHAVLCYRDGEPALGHEELRRAFATDDTLVHEEEWLLEFIAGSATDPRTPSASALIDTICESLPVAPSAVRSLRRRARGRYHCIAAFDAYRRGDWGGLRSQARRAVSADPALLLNRGFVSITLRAFGDLFRAG